ncbi:hypothetical protein FF38_09339 [Lucilia cuprina]|uniref:F-box domain-containing protein n=1 Tax=Lucilia cuprina TaxID=7375 RepID=A0A0L0BNP7_LUCCU|nr:hypothetical protein FF38_09339 [Lucilia cuprina]
MDDTMKVKDQCHNATTTTNDKVNAETILSLQQQQQHHNNVVPNPDVGSDAKNATAKLAEEDQMNNESSDAGSESPDESNGKMYHINMLPDEMLEFILTYLPPYKDLENCSLVCKRWQDIVKKSELFIFDRNYTYSIGTFLMSSVVQENLFEYDLLVKKRNSNDRLFHRPLLRNNKESSSVNSEYC